MGYWLVKGGRITDNRQEKVVSIVDEIIFTNKQNIPWNEVEKYLKRYIGNTYVVAEYQDYISIAGDFPDEYAESQYTKKLRGAVAKAKANASQIVGNLIVNATNRRWVENKNDKHNRDASEGWYRYDVYFAIPVQGSSERNKRLNYYSGTLVVRKTIHGLFLYDMINIKKEASMPLESK